MTTGLEEHLTHSYKTRATPRQRALLKRIHAADAGRVYRGVSVNWVQEAGASGETELRAISRGGVARLIVNGWLKRVEVGEGYIRVYVLSEGGLRVLALYGDVPRVELVEASSGTGEASGTPRHL